MDMGFMMPQVWADAFTVLEGPAKHSQMNLILVHPSNSHFSSCFRHPLMNCFLEVPCFVGPEQAMLVPLSSMYCHSIVRNS